MLTSIEKKDTIDWTISPARSISSVIMVVYRAVDKQWTKSQHQKMSHDNNHTIIAPPPPLHRTLAPRTWPLPQLSSSNHPLLHAHLPTASRVHLDDQGSVGSEGHVGHVEARGYLGSLLWAIQEVLFDPR